MGRGGRGVGGDVTTLTHSPTSIVRLHLRGHGWVPLAELLARCAGSGLTPSATDRAVTQLLLTGDVDRRWRPVAEGAWTRGAELRLGRG